MILSILVDDKSALRKLEHNLGLWGNSLVLKVDLFEKFGEQSLTP